MKRIALISFIVFWCYTKTLAQGGGMPKIYFSGNDVKVTEQGVAKTNPWCGGVNNPQFGLADLNKDGKQDLVIFENQSGVKTFINTGSNGAPNYVYNGNYEADFPERIFTFLKLVDYNDDKIPDLIDWGGTGFGAWRGYYSSDGDPHLKFEYYKKIFFKVSNGWENAYSHPVDIPIVFDVDKDGDLDFLAFDDLGYVISFYRNCRIEEGLPPDSIKVCYADRCWGRLRQFVNREHVLNYPCTENQTRGTTCKGCGNDGSGNKTTHTGNTLCMLDMDGDGDYDILNGNISNSDIQFFENGRADLNLQLDSVIAQDTIWGANGSDVYVSTMPAAFHMDIDQDGDKDLLFSPMGQESENYKSIVFYENQGDDNAPNFKYRTNTYMVDDMIDIGLNARPVFYDYNKDGKPDLFIGSDGYYMVNGTLKTMISYYENTSEPGYPSYKLVTKDFMNLSFQNLQGASLAFGDLDADGKDDMVIGERDGTINFYKDTVASSSMQNRWKYISKLRYDSTKPKDSVRIIDMGNNAVPLIYDLDKDGRNDLILGHEWGELYFYKNTGNPDGGFKLMTDKLGGVEVRQAGYASNFPVPFIGAIDDSKKEYLLIGSVRGEIYVYDGFQDGYDPSKKYTLLDNDYQYIYAGRRSAPAAADIDGDGKYELLVGVALGGANLYRQLYTVGTKDPGFVKSRVKVYPNPARDVLNLSWTETFSEGSIDISLITVTGQKVLQQSVPASQGSAGLNISELSPGIYYVIVQSAENRAVSAVSIVR